MKLLILTAVAFAGLTQAQWLDYPTKGVPRDAAGKPDGNAPTPRLADGKPDFSGIWSPDRNFIYDMTDAMKKGDEFPIQPWALKLAKDRQSEEDPEALCLPTGVPRLAPYPWSIVQGPKHIYIVFEGNIHSYRQIFMDNRKHSADPNPSWYGESIGHYEGDTLVIDTIGFNDKSWLDAKGTGHSEDLRIEERFHRRDFGHIDLTTTVTDPKTFTKPIVFSVVEELMPDTDLLEHYCQENEKDGVHGAGK